MKIVEETPYRFRIEREGAMRVPGVVFASRALLPDIATDEALAQVANVATLPGIVTASYAMPDIHWGYAFPIGGVAATDVADGGVVSPGGVGFDISCGVRLLAAGLDRDALAPKLSTLMDRLGHTIPRGLRRGAVWPLAGRSMGTASYVLAGVPGNPAFDSTCHGAGRTQSRHQAARTVRGRELRDRLEAAGIAVRGASWRGLAEEAPTAYKDIDAVAEAAEAAGLCRKIARLVPLGVVKG